MVPTPSCHTLYSKNSKKGHHHVGTPQLQGPTRCPVEPVGGVESPALGQEMTTPSFPLSCIVSQTWSFIHDCSTCLVSPSGRGLVLEVDAQRLPGRRPPFSVSGTGCMVLHTHLMTDPDGLLGGPRQLLCPTPKKLNSV